MDVVLVARVIHVLMNVKETGPSVDSIQANSALTTIHSTNLIKDEPFSWDRREGESSTYEHGYKPFAKNVKCIHKAITDRTNESEQQLRYQPCLYWLSSRMKCCSIPPHCRSMLEDSCEAKSSPH